MGFRYLYFLIKSNDTDILEDKTLTLFGRYDDLQGDSGGVNSYSLGAGVRF